MARGSRRQVGKERRFGETRCIFVTSKENLLRGADALRDLARRTRHVVDLAGIEDQKKMLRRHADDFDKEAGKLEAMAIDAKSMPMAPSKAR